MGKKSEKANVVTLSKQRVLNSNWRQLPEREMTIGEMESYAAGLSDEELWVELEKTYDDWFELNQGRKWFYQPRLAVMLAREIGKRDGELGMKELARWLEKRDGEVESWEEDPLKMERQFGNLRVLMASYGGWVSDDPEEAIERLIESGENEEGDWPVMNAGFTMYIKISDYFAVEEILRDGFYYLMRKDQEIATRLLVRGVKVWAFDPILAAGVVIDRLPESEKEKFWAIILSEEEDVDIRNMIFAFSPGGQANSPLFWSEDLETYFPNRGEEWSVESLRVIALLRPNNVQEILERDLLSVEKEKDLAALMGSHNSRYYSLIEELPDDQKVDLVNEWLVSLGEFKFIDFGPITGKENPGSLDLEKLREVVKETEMSDEVRVQIEEMLDEWGD